MDTKIEDCENSRLNSELLHANDTNNVPTSPKRNTKDGLIAKVLKVVSTYELDFEYSDTKLRRMNKTELTKLLARVMEESVKIDMARSVGVDPRANGKVITLGALRMLHNVCAVGFEKTFNVFGTRLTGYESVGFADSLRDPQVQHAVDECLTEIAATNPEVLQYFDSPYSRLALVWGGALLTCLKKKQITVNRRRYAPNLARQSNREPSPVRLSSSGGEAVREKHGNLPSSVPHVLKV